MANKNRKVQLESGVDSTGARKGFNEIKADAKDMAQAVGKAGQDAGQGLEKGVGAGSDAAAKQLERDSKSIAAQIQRLTAAAKAGGKDTAEYFEIITKQRGLNQSLLNPLIAEYAAVQRAQRAAQGTLDGMGLSAKQTTAALRQVPAQFTDIVTSLQGGQNPLTVLLQQGGQLKDTFGGAGPAAAALGRYVLGLVNPFTLAAAAAVGLAFAYNKGADEDARFRRSVILTGGAAGATARELQAMAAAVDAQGAGTRSRAAEIINQLAQDSAVGAGNLQRFAAAAIQLEKVGGPAAEETARAFSSLAKSPLEAALKLNEGTNFLTRAVYEQIRALEQQGRTSEAATIAQVAFFDALQNRTPQMQASLGYIERGWNAIKDAVKGAGDAVLQFGRDQTDAERLKELQDRIAARAAGGSLMSRGGRRQSTLDRENEEDRQALQMLSRRMLSQREAAGAQYVLNEQLKAAAQFDKEAVDLLPKRAQLEREIVRIRNLGAAGGKSQAEIERSVAAAREKFADKTRPKADINDRSSVDAIKRELDELTGAYADAEKILAAQRQAGAISEADYYLAKRAFIEASRDAQIAALREENVELEKLNSNRKLSAESRLANDKAIADNAAKMVRINNEAATSLEVLSTQQTSALNAVEVAYRDARRAAEDYLATIQRDIDREAVGRTVSDRDLEIMRGRDQVRDGYNAERRRIRNERESLRDAQGGFLDGEQEANFRRRLDLQDEYEKKATAKYDGGVDDRLKAESKWQTGASKAFANYLADAENVAEQTKRVFDRGFQSMEDALARFVTTGKLDFKSFADAVIADLTRVFVKQALINPLKAAAGSFLGIPGFANGGAFDPMGEVKRFAAGDIFDKPTAFSYAGGSRAGILGEAGPEAVMPLARGAGGKLGVMVNAGGRPAPQINYSQYINIDGAADRARGLQEAELIMRKGQREFADMLKARGVL